MTTNSTIFKIREGYILLEDLEDWYSRGFVTSNDRIRIYENGGKRMGSYKISALIKIYGSAFPFRRVARPRVHDPLAADTSSDEDDGASTPASSRPESPFEPDYGPNPSGIGSAPPLSLEPQEPEKTIGGAFGAQKPSQVGPATRGVGSPISAGSRTPLKPQTGPEPEPNSEPKRTMGGAFGAQKPLQAEPAAREVGSSAFSGPKSPVEPELGPGPKPNSEPIRTMGGAFGAQKSPEVGQASRGMGPMPNEYLDRPGPIPHQFMAPPMIPVRSVLVSEPATEPRFEYRDYPLYCVHMEADEDWITGREVIEEMRLLENMVPTRRNWTTKEGDYFYFLNRKNYTREGVASVAICRLCDHTPYGGRLFFKHLFDFGHVQKLSQHRISRKSFQYWKDHIEKCQRSPATVPLARVFTATVPQKSTVTQNTNSKSIDLVFKKIPLFASGTGTDSLKMSEIENLVDLFTAQKTGVWGDDNFLAKYYEMVECTMHCDACDFEMPHNTYKFTKHILSMKHLKALNNISQNDVNFWINYLNIQLFAKNGADLCRVLKLRNPRPIPLLDFKLESTPIPASIRSAKLAELQDKYKALPKDVSLAENRSIGSFNHEKIACFACNLPIGHFKSRGELLEHIFTDGRHFEYLLLFGFPEKAVEWWNRFFEEIKTTVTTSPTVSPSTVSRNSNVPRVPLMDLPVDGARRSGQKLFILSMRAIVTSLQQSGRDEAATRKIYWKCYYCSTAKSEVYLYNELLAFIHITSQKHLEKMKFTAPIDDLNHWKNWAITINLTRLPPINIQMTSPIQKSSEVQKTSEAPTTSEIPPNVPRVAMLDKMPPNVSHVNHKNKIYTYLGNYNRRFHKIPLDKLEKARAMRVDWHCTYCRDTPNPVLIPNMMYAFNHIMSSRHWENMKHTASIEDLNFWKNWAHEILNDITPETAPKDPKIEKSRSTTPVNEEKKKKREKKGGRMITNDPRVPMFDEIPANEEAVSKERFNEILDECEAIFKKNSRKMFGAPHVHRDMRCTYCSSGANNTMASSYTNAFCHIVKEKHREQMNYRASESDLQYWKSWVQKLDAQVNKGTVPADLKEATKNTVELESVPEPPTEKSPVKSPQSINASTNSIEQASSFPLFGKVSIAGTPCSGPTNIQMTIAKALKPKEDRLDEIKPFFSTPQKCDYCGVRMTDWTIDKVIQHAFGVRHLVKVKRDVGTIIKEDFDYWINRVQELQHPWTLPIIFPLPRTLNMGINTIDLRDGPAFYGFDEEEGNLFENIDVTKLKTMEQWILLKYGGCEYCDIWLTTPIDVIIHYCRKDHFNAIRKFRSIVRPDVDWLLSIVKSCQKISQNEARTTPSPEIEQYCELPLFLNDPSGRIISIDDTLCIGPTNTQVDLITRIEYLPGEDLMPHFCRNVKCKCCNINMSGWTILSVLRHAFTVSHLEKLEKMGVKMYAEDFESWISRLKQIQNLLTSPKPTVQSTTRYLGLFRRLEITIDLIMQPVFKGFSSEERQLFSQLNPEKLEANGNEILKKFGGCAYCNVWLLNPFDVVVHYTSDNHFENIRKERMTFRADVVGILQVLRSCQKDDNKCIVM